ncbi:MAG: hypothetical protein IPK89_02565 [Sphingomonadales bacterium]|nr:hypothetical protein [Sphingomonadales bacterium]
MTAILTQRQWRPIERLVPDLASTFTLPQDVAELADTGSRVGILADAACGLCGDRDCLLRTGQAIEIARQLNMTVMVKPSPFGNRGPAAIG